MTVCFRTNSMKIISISGKWEDFSPRRMIVIKCANLPKSVARMWQIKLKIRPITVRKTEKKKKTKQKKLFSPEGKQLLGCKCDLQPNKPTTFFDRLTASGRLLSVPRGKLSEKIHLSCPAGFDVIFPSCGACLSYLTKVGRAIFILAHEKAQQRNELQRSTPQQSLFLFFSVWIDMQEIFCPC